MKLQQLLKNEHRRTKLQLCWFFSSLCNLITITTL